MEIENFILQHFRETGVWLPTGKKYEDEQEEEKEDDKIV